MINAVMPVTIALVMAVVAGALVWLVWSLIENLRAARRAKLISNSANLVNEVVADKQRHENVPDNDRSQIG